MQQRHLNRKQYFCELANTARTFYMEYLNTYIKLTPDTRVLEIGCGEGGNLLPFAEQGCKVIGIDICQTRINEAQTFLQNITSRELSFVRIFSFQKSQRRRMNGMTSYLFTM